MSACHPFYTGKLKYVDTAGRIEKFQKKFAGGNYASPRGKKRMPTPPPPNQPSSSDVQIRLKPDSPVRWGNAPLASASGFKYVCP